MRPVMAHYFYFPATEEQNVKAVWQSIPEFMGVTTREPLPDELVIVASNLSLLRAAEKYPAQRFLGLMDGVAVVELLFAATGQPEDADWQTYLARLDKLREELAPHLAGMIGQGTLLIASDRNRANPTDFLTHFFPSGVFFQTELADGAVLIHIQDDFPEYHRYLFATGKPVELALPFFTHTLPYLDAMLFTVAQAEKEMQQQYAAVVADKRDGDEVIGKILEELRLSAGGGETVGQLERRMEELSAMYTRLTNHILALQQAQNRFAKMRARFLETAESIGNPGALSYFRELGQGLARHETLLEEGICQLGRSQTTIRTIIELFHMRMEIAHSKERSAVESQLQTFADQYLLLIKEQQGFRIAAVIVLSLIVIYDSFVIWRALTLSYTLAAIPAFMQVILLGGLGAGAMMAAQRRGTGKERGDRGNRLPRWTIAVLGTVMVTSIALLLVTLR